MVVQFKRKPDIVAGVKWNGHNLIEVENFLGYGFGFPTDEEGLESYIQEQTKYRENGFNSHMFRPFEKAFVGQWVVKFADGAFGIRNDFDIDAFYDIEGES